MLASTALACENDKKIEAIHKEKKEKIELLARILDASNKIPLKEPLKVFFYPIPSRHDITFSEEHTTKIIGFFSPTILSPIEKAE